MNLAECPMATQTYVNDIQAMNPANVQQNASKSPVVSQAQVVQQQPQQPPQAQVQVQPTQQVQQQQAQVQQLGQPPQQQQQQQQQQQTSTPVTGGAIQKVSQAPTTIIQPAQAHTGHSYIVATSVPEAAAEQSHEQTSVQQSGQTVYSAHVQYVDANDQAIYTAANGQMPAYQEYAPNTMYSSVGGAYYQTAGSQMATNITHVQSIQGQIITQHGGTYVIQSSPMDGEGAPLSHTTRASPATVQWLLDNYETAEGVSLPRSTLYNHYLRHCQEQNLDPMNPASFGKLIRSVFIGLRTRRLGTRGNSKYHYYGIRIKANSPLNQFTDEQTMALRQQPIYQGKKMRFANNKVEGCENDSMYSHYNNTHQDTSQTQQQHHQQFLGDASGAIPNFVEVDTSQMPLPDGIMFEHIRTFEKVYREHAEAIVDAVVNLQFSLIEALWQGFWRNQTPEQQQNTDNNYEKRLPKDKLYTMCKYEPLQKYVQRSDYAFYQALVEVLIPDVLRPIPSSLTQAIRNFAKSLENWLKGAMHGVPDEMVKTKVSAVGAFAQTLRRYTSLNHLAQAARAVLQNTSQINQMLTDLNRVDFANVQEQASWVCQCEDSMVHQLEQDFKKTLQSQNSLEQWAVWLEGVVNQILKPHEGSSNFPKAARQFLLKWSFYSSMVIRDLTLRSAASFGSFHLIRLLYDEYMFYLVEHKVAAATDETPIAVMGEVRQFIDLGNTAALNSFDSTDNTVGVGMKPAYIPHTVINSSGNGHAVESASTSTNATATVMVLTPAISHTGNVTTSTTTVQTNPITNAHQVTLRATPATAQIATGQKTIVVMPVSTVGAGDPHSMKRMKTE